MVNDKRLLNGLIDMDWQASHWGSVENQFLRMEEMNEENAGQERTVLDDIRKRADMAEVATRGQTYGDFNYFDEICELEEPF